MRRHARLAALVAALALLLAASWVLPVGQWSTAALAFFQTRPEVAWILFVGLYVLAAVLLVPGFILTVSAGFLFGLPLGVVLVSAGSVLGATAAFLLGRFLARDWVAARTAHWRRFAALDRAVERRGFLIVLLVRLSPLFPFNLLNYALGLTGVALRHFVLASWIGMLPATVVYVWAGSLAQSLTAAAAGEVEAGLAGQLLFALGLAATFAVTVVATRLAGRELDRHLAGEQPAAPR